MSTAPAIDKDWASSCVDWSYRPLAVWLSGSLVEGLAHAHSDVDIFAVCEEFCSTSAPTKDYGDHRVHVTFKDQRRVDVEYWTRGAILQLAGKLDAFNADTDQVNWLGYLSEDELDLIHRVHVGQPLFGDEFLEQIRQALSRERLGEYLKENKRLYLDDAFDDVVGLYKVGQLMPAAFRARSVVEFAIDYLLYCAGGTNPREKHRFRLLMDSRHHPLVAGYADELLKLASCVPLLSQQQQRTYVERSLALSERIYMDING